MYRVLALISLVTVLVLGPSAQASALATGAREAAEYILQKFGKRVPTQTADDLAQEISRASSRHLISNEPQPPEPSAWPWVLSARQPGPGA
jgi:hypothetical protein